MGSDRKFREGMAIRREVLGTEYVNAASRAGQPWEQEFQHLITEYCWGTAWNDERLTRRERSLLVLGITGALGRLPEFALHLRGALNNGLTVEELGSAVIQLAVYAGIPAGVTAMHALREAAGELGASSGDGR